MMRNTNIHDSFYLTKPLCPRIHKENVTSKQKIKPMAKYILQDRFYTVKSAVLIKQCYSIFTLKELTQQQIVKDTP